MTISLYQILNMCSHISVLVAICCLTWHCVYGALEARQGRETAVMNDAAWLGLAYWGAWLACELGKTLVLKG